MFVANTLDLLFVFWAFLFQLILIIHFALRRWRFDTAVKYGWVIYALSVPAVIISLLLLLGGQPWALWLGGFLYLVWAIYGFTIEYVLQIQWRHPPRWPVLVIYLTLYLATVTFYWWPLGLISRPLWYAYAILFIISTALNLASHRKTETQHLLY